MEKALAANSASAGGQAELMRRGRSWLAIAGVAAVVLLSGCSTGEEPIAPNADGSGGTSQTTGAPPSTPAGGTGSAGTASGGLTVSGTISDSLSTPWSMAVLPGGAVLVSERDSAAIKRIDDGNITMVGTVDNVVPGGEGGLLGLAVAPTFTEDRYLYAYYTSANDNRIVRMKYDDGASPSLGPQQVVLEGIPKATIHNGGRIKFGPDGMLYAGTGDATREDEAQDPDSLAGKILRITPDGEPAEGNPFGDNPVYSLGHRNVQGLAWDSQGRLWASEFGPSMDDELNLITPGANYGWPDVTGAPGAEEFVDAQVVWPSTATASPSGMAILDDVAYIGALRGQRLWAVPLNDGQAGEPASHFQDDYGRLRDVVVGPNDVLWVATNSGPEEQILLVEPS